MLLWRFDVGFLDIEKDQWECCRSAAHINESNKKKKEKEYASRSAALEKLILYGKTERRGNKVDIKQRIWMTYVKQKYIQWQLTKLSSY